MRGISSSDLAGMLTRGFEGDVEFEADISCRLKWDGKKDSEGDIPPTFYHAEGKFRLQGVGEINGTVEGAYALMNIQGITLYFKPKRETKIKADSFPKSGEYILIELDFPTKAIMQIDSPRNIKY